jgi:hypothetical protein
MELVLPQLVNIPGTESAPSGIQGLPRRPAGGASQSAAEATLGLVTIDTLGLAGTGVPSASAPELDQRIWDRSLNSLTRVSTPTIYAGDMLLVVGALAVGAGETDIAIASVTMHLSGPEPGPEIPFNGSGAWWWYQFIASPGGTNRVVTVTATAMAQVLFVNFAKFLGRAIVNAPGASATGATQRISIARPSGGMILDQGRVLTAVKPIADSVQTVDYDNVTTTAPNRQWFASHRTSYAEMGWTGQAGAAWMISAIGVSGE